MQHHQNRWSGAELLQDGPFYTDILHTHPLHDDDAVLHLTASDIMEIALVEKGSGIHQILTQSLPCKQGDIYLLPPDLPHGFFVSSAEEELQVRRLFFDLKDWLDGDLIRPDSPHYCYGAFREGGGVSYALLNSYTHQKVNHLMDSICREAALQRNDWKDATRAYLSLLLITLGRYVSNAIQTLPVLTHTEWRLISPTLRMVTEHFAESELTLRTIADTLFVSTSHLSRLFKRFTGEQFSAYLRRVRLQHACRLLGETDYTVDRIVRLCGLRDVPSFYHSFHEHTGMTPHQYRIHYHITHHLKEGEKIMSILREISEHLQKGKGKIVKELVQKALDEGCSPADILDEGLLSGMNVIGEKFRNNEVFVPEVLVAARAMKMGTEILKPHLNAAGVKANGKVCIGTVQGDLHDIGKNLVKMMMEGKGLEVVDLGVDVAPETFVSTAIEQGCQVICCSALLTTTMDVMAQVVKAADAAGIRDKVKIMIGGAPINEEFCQKIGADCYTSDAASAANAAVELCK